jgi:hypothetical protein
MRLRFAPGDVFAVESTALTLLHREIFGAGAAIRVPAFGEAVRFR